MAETPRRRRLPSTWLDIPLELADLVLGRLRAHADRVRFAAVCPQWRAAARQARRRLSPPLPLLVFRHGTGYSIPENHLSRFPRCANYTDACGNWLVFSGEDGCFLRDPCSNATVMLPALSRIRVRSVYDETGRTWIEHEDTRGLTLHKVVFCSPHLIAAFVSVKHNQNAKIAVCRPGANSWWSVRMNGQSHRFLDMAFHQGKLYAYDYFVGLCAIDIRVSQSTGDPWISQIRWIISNVNGPLNYELGFVRRKIYLVQSCGALLILRQMIHDSEKRTVIAAEQNEFDVFKADFGLSTWLMLATIGENQVLFLRPRCSKSVCVSEHEMPGDRIIFMENDEEEDRDRYDKESSSSCSIYNMTDGSVSTLLPTVTWKRGLRPTWLFPQD